MGANYRHARILITFIYTVNDIYPVLTLTILFSLVLSAVLNTPFIMIQQTVLKPGQTDLSRDDSSVDRDNPCQRRFNH